MFGYLFVCLAVLPSMWDPSSLTRDWTRAACSGNAESRESPHHCFKRQKGERKNGKKENGAGKWQGRIRWSSLDNQAQRKRNPELILSRYSPSRKELYYIESQLGAWVPHQLLLLLFPGREWIFVGYCVRVKKRKSLLAIAQAVELVFLFRLFWKLDFQGWWENERAALGTFVYQGGALDFTLKTLQV